MKTRKTHRKPRKILSKPKTTRVTVDFQTGEHRKLKAMAALEGVTLQEYIRTHVMEKVNAANIPDAKFRRLMEKILEEDEDLLRRLANQ